LIKSELTNGQVVFYGKTMQDGKIIQKGFLNKPLTVLMTGVSNCKHFNLGKGTPSGSMLIVCLSRTQECSKTLVAENPKADYDHIDSGKGCKSCCDEKRLVRRIPMFQLSTMDLLAREIRL
jgi:hypothetical protein